VTTCKELYDDDLFSFNVAVVVSVLLTLVKIVIFCFIPTHHLAKLYGTGGICKILIALGLFFIWWPECPSACNCTLTIGQVYPLLALVVGLLWLLQACMMNRRNNSLSASNKHEEEDNDMITDD